MYGVAIFEGGFSVDKSDLMTPDRLLDHLAFFFNHGVLTIHKVLDGQVFLERIVNAIQAALLKTREIQRRFTKSFGRNCPRVDPCATYIRCAFDQRDTFSVISRFRSTLFPRWPSANNDQIIFFCQIRYPNTLLNKSDSSKLFGSQRCFKFIEFYYCFFTQKCTRGFSRCFAVFGKIETTTCLEGPYDQILQHLA